MKKIGKYEVLGKLGQGAMGVVYKARDPFLQRVVAVKTMSADFAEMDIRTSFIDRLPFSHRKFELYIPLYAFAMEQFDFREYDVVLSVSTMVAKGLITGPRTCHISLCFTPMRWA